ncbi:hypothetical protein [Mycolicibacterium hodleri]|nr:hypothetical protein [Mycolicibacterium hodleri]
MSTHERRTEEHLTAEEDDGSAELQPEDGGSASTPLDESSAAQSD